MGTVPGRHILIIEDNDDTADALARLLRWHGHRVAVPRSGPEGLRLALATRPGLILLDLGLPGMDGYEVATRLRARDDFDEVAIIALTAHGGESYRLRSAE